MPSLAASDWNWRKDSNALRCRGAFWDFYKAGEALTDVCVCSTRPASWAACWGCAGARSSEIPAWNGRGTKTVPTRRKKKKNLTCFCDILSPEEIKRVPADSCWLDISTTPFFFEQVDGKSLSSTFTEGRLHFILQKNERLAPEQSLDGPGVMSVFTGRPAANTQHDN